MKRKFLLILVTLFVSAGILYLQLGREPIVNCSMILENSDSYDLSLVVTLNKLVILNRKNIEHTIIQKTLDNDFENIHFSHDVYGMPQKICVTVYANALTYMLNVPAFEFQYIYPYFSKDRGKHIINASL